MTQKKKTTGKRSKQKRTSRKRVLAWFAGLLLCSGGALAALYFFYSGQPDVFLPQPAYEEVHSRPPGLRQDIGRIDRTVYDVLYRWGIYESDILFTDVAHRSVEGDAWDFTEMAVRLSGEEALQRVRKDLRAELEALEPCVAFYREEETAGRDAYRVYARGRYTHRIQFEFPGTGTKPVLKKRVPRVAIIIDDLGYDRRLARAFATLDIPVALSVLPMAPFTEDVAAEAGRNGCELMLHLPMEPRDHQGLNPGPGALYKAMTPKEIRTLLLRHLEQVPGAMGVNNHMGSSFTEHGGKMAVVLEEIRKKGLFFVDSRTTAHSVAYDMARDMGIPAMKRSVFLDNEPTEGAIEIQLERLLGVARHRGAAVGIGHPFPGTLAVLEREACRLSREVDMVRVSELLE